MSGDVGDNIREELDKFKTLKAQKMRWFSIWQLVGEFIHTRKQDFNNTTEPGDFLVHQVFDSNGPKSLRQFVAAVLGMIWQSANTSMQIIPAESIQDSQDVKEFFDKMNKTVGDAMDDPKAGLSIALEEYMVDQGSFGTSGVGVFKGDESDLLFQSYGIDEIHIAEAANSFVDTIYREFEWELSKVLERWGEDALSSDMLESVRNKKLNNKIKILHVIERRRNIDKTKKDNLNMPYKSKYIALNQNHLLHESGFEEMPIFISRFFKRKTEVYGRSPGMDALPDILELNATREARMLAIEKALDPPLGVFNDSLVGNGKIDTSSGGINVVKATGKLGSGSPIFPLFSVGNIREADKSIEDLAASVKEHFLLDRLLDTSNRTQMTLGEVQIRNQMRAESMGSIFSRIIREMLTPLIERSVNIQFRDNKFGTVSVNEEDDSISIQDMPKEVAELILKGESFYDIVYFTPAVRIMKAEEAQGILRAWEFAGNVSGLDRSVVDNLDADKSLEIISKISGAPSSILKSSKQVVAIREARAAAQAEQAKLNQIQQGAEAAKQVGEAEKANVQETA